MIMKYNQGYFSFFIKKDKTKDCKTLFSYR